MVKKLKTKNPSLLYVCDTVMGDGGCLYVAPEIVPLYRQIMHIADLVTPNQFEAETLAEVKIDSLASACQAAEQLHTFGCPRVVITSMAVPLSDIPADIRLPTSSEDSLYCLTSEKTSHGLEQHIIAFPTYTGYFTGTGDLFSALMVARLQQANETGASLATAALQVVSSVNAVTKKTWLYQRKYVNITSHGEADLIEQKPNAPDLIRRCELRIVQGKPEIEDPSLIGQGVIKMTRL
ncbi:pyridoxal kinase [Radiomyces spectabilis]|uniref:pyridoxal kinase n=1 Tax=Radiomyces spectabilis TaxID=64574 RepID=UPI002220DAB7|nr:pyridoxal kinase [Radiomyces spectabilis]KAI8381295.1 pyridoxal kinase [Radiomyces spectabilis]